MTNTITEDPRRVAMRGVRRSPLVIALRPFGYTLIGLVWLTIWLIVLLIPVASAAYFVTDESLVEGLRARFSSPVDIIAIVVICIPAMTLVMGPGVWQLATASWPLMVLSFTYVLRSLRPSYSQQKLSYTNLAPPNSNPFGPPTPGGVALSLQPVRPSRFTEFVMRFYVAGWSLDGKTFLAMLPVGLAWTTAVVGFFPGLPDLVHGVFLALTAALALTSVVLGVRRFRQRFTPPGARR